MRYGVLYVTLRTIQSDCMGNSGKDFTTPSSTIITRQNRKHKVFETVSEFIREVAGMILARLTEDHAVKRIKLIFRLERIVQMQYNVSTLDSEVAALISKEIEQTKMRLHQ